MKPRSHLNALAGEAGFPPRNAGASLKRPGGRGAAANDGAFSPA